MVDGAELKDAIHAVGRGKGSHNEIRAYIMKRARELKRPNLIPTSWRPGGVIMNASMAPHTGEDPGTCLACKKG